jgi:hypothetical protein
MGRKITDGEAVDVTAPDATLIEKGELYRINGWTGFALDEITVDEEDRAIALEVCQSIWRCKVPTGTCGTRGGYVKWSSNPGASTFAKASTDLVDEASDVRTVATIAKVEGVRNSNGYATLKLLLV